MTQDVLLLTVTTIKSKKNGMFYDIFYVYQDGRINTIIIPNKNESQVNQHFDYVKQGGKLCKCTITLQGTRVSYTEITIG